MSRVLGFLYAHFISSIVAATTTVMMLLLFEAGLKAGDYVFLIKLWGVSVVFISLVVLPFSVIFYGIPEWKKINMPIRIYAALGAGFAIVIMTFLILFENKGISSEEALRAYSTFMPPGALAGMIFGFLRHGYPVS